MSTAENKAILHRYIDEVWGKGNTDIMDELMAADYVANPHGSVGQDYMKREVAKYRIAFPDLQITVDLMMAEDDLVMACATMRGTHEGEFMGFAPTGRRHPVTLTVIYLNRIRDGRIVEGWGEMNVMSLLQQLGAVLPALLQKSGPVA